jgi:hypothetical protein
LTVESNCPATKFQGSRVHSPERGTRWALGRKLARRKGSEAEVGPGDLKGRKGNKRKEEVRPPIT